MPSMEVMQEVGERKIVYSDIDYNGHMNNTHYPDMLCDFTPGIRARRAVGITLSFLGEATFGHVLRVLRADRGEHEFYFRTVNEEGKTCLEAMLITEPIQSVQ